MSEPAFLDDATAPYPLEYATARMRDGIAAFPAARDDEARDALVGFVARVARDCSREAERRGLLLRADVLDLLADALDEQPRDRPISTDRAGVYHALADASEREGALDLAGPLVGLLALTL